MRASWTLPDHLITTSIKRYLCTFFERQQTKQNRAIRSINRFSLPPLVTIIHRACLRTPTADLMWFLLRCKDESLCSKRSSSLWTYETSPSNRFRLQHHVRSDPTTGLSSRVFSNVGVWVDSLPAGCENYVSAGSDGRLALPTVAEEALRCSNGDELQQIPRIRHCSYDSSSTPKVLLLRWCVVYEYLTTTRASSVACSCKLNLRFPHIFHGQKPFSKCSAPHRWDKIDIYRKTNTYYIFTLFITIYYDLNL